MGLTRQEPPRRRRQHLRGISSRRAQRSCSPTVSAVHHFVLQAFWSWSWKFGGAAVLFAKWAIPLSSVDIEIGLVSRLSYLARLVWRAPRWSGRHGHAGR